MLAAVLGIGLGVPFCLQFRRNDHNDDTDGNPPRPGHPKQEGAGLRSSSSIIFGAVTLIVLLVATAWGNAAAMFIGAFLLIAAGLLVFGRERWRWNILVTLAALGIAGAIALLLARRADHPSATPDQKASHAPEKAVVGSLRLIGAVAHGNLVIARSESVTGFPAHEIVARFAGAALSPEQWRSARAGVTGPVLAPSATEGFGDDWAPEPISSIALLRDYENPTNRQPGSCWFACPNECQLQFAMGDEVEAAEACRQILEKLSKPNKLVLDRRLELFTVGDRRAWLEVRSMNPPKGKLAFITSDINRLGNSLVAGRSPVMSVGTNQVNSAVISLPPHSILSVTGELQVASERGKFSGSDAFSICLTNPVGQAGLYWLSWKARDALKGQSSGWEVFIHDAKTTHQLYHFVSQENPEFAWRPDWSESVAANPDEMIEEVILVSNPTNLPPGAYYPNALLRVKLVIQPSASPQANVRVDFQNERAG